MLTVGLALPTSRAKDCIIGSMGNLGTSIGTLVSHKEELLRIVFFFILHPLPMSLVMDHSIMSVKPTLYLLAITPN